MDLVLCPHCHRHVRETDQACPFCGRRRISAPSTLGTAALVVAGVGLAVLLCACYGPPPRALEVVKSPEDLVGALPQTTEAAPAQSPTNR
jgi:hypothetical protein